MDGWFPLRCVLVRALVATCIAKCKVGKSTRYRIEKWFWMCNVPIVLALVLFWRSLWDVVSLPYVAFLSIYALVLTLSGAEQAAEAANAARS